MTYFISDIHGEYKLLNELLRLINFSQNDKLIVAGDMIEKGEDSVAVVQLLRKLNAKCVIGNHEYGFLKRYWALLRESQNNFDSVLKQLQNVLSDGYKLTWGATAWKKICAITLKETLKLSIKIKWLSYSLWRPLFNVFKFFKINCANGKI